MDMTLNYHTRLIISLHKIHRKNREKTSLSRVWLICSLFVYVIFL